MRVAVIDMKTGEVVNMIMADANAQPPVGCVLKEIPADLPVDQRWHVDEKTQTFDSKDAEVIAGRIEAERIETERVEYEKRKAEPAPLEPSKDEGKR